MFQLAFKGEQGLVIERMGGRYRRLNEHIQKIFLGKCAKRGIGNYLKLEIEKIHSLC